MPAFSALRSDSPLFSMRVHASIKASYCGPVALIQGSRNSRTVCALRPCTKQISISCPFVGHVFTLESSSKCAPGKQSRVTCYLAIVRPVYLKQTVSSALLSFSTLTIAHVIATKQYAKYRTKFRTHGG